MGEVRPEVSVYPAAEEVEAAAAAAAGVEDLLLVRTELEHHLQGRIGWELEF